MTTQEIANDLVALCKQGKKAWAETFEVHSMEVGNAIVADNYFATTFSLDTTNRQTKVRTKSSEIALYHLKDGKIVSEQFFYDM